MNVNASTNHTAVTLSLGAARYPAKLGRPDSKSVFFLDPPSGLGRQTPARAKISLQLATDALEVLVAHADETNEIVLVDRKGETRCESVEVQQVDDAAFGNGYLVMRTAQFRDWAHSEGRLIYESYNHTWQRHPA